MVCDGFCNKPEDCNPLKYTFSSQIIPLNSKYSFYVWSGSDLKYFNLQIV